MHGALSVIEWRHEHLRLVGAGFAAQGWGGAAGYSRLAASRDPRAAFIFEGIGDDEVIGDFGLVLDGAAGDEIDLLTSAWVRRRMRCWS